VFYLGFIRPSCRHLCLAALMATVALHVDAQHSAGHPFSNRDRLSPIPEPRAQDDEFERVGTASETPMRPVGGSISVALLKHHVPGKARREFVRVGDETRKGHLEAAIQHLKKAIEIDPAYMEAQNNLGARYIELGDHEQAIPHLRTASRLDPTSIFARTNLGIALWFGGHGSEAEQVASDAVRLAPGFLRAQYLLGLILNAKASPEALQHLKKSAAEIPEAWQLEYC
jgi:TPR repeat protein